MHNIEHQVRLHLPDFPSDELETRYAWRWKLYWALAVLGALGAVWLAWVLA